MSSQKPRLERLVVADDEMLVAEFIVDILKELDYRVVATVPDGSQAVEACRREHPDMVLLDIHMPRMNGIEAARQIWGELHIPVVIISAYSDPQYARATSEIGVFGYLLKPTSRDFLRTTLTVAWGQYTASLEKSEKIARLEQRLEDRKEIERAKWFLVQQLSISEDEAMKRLQKQARDNRRTLVDVARGILENQQLFTNEPRIA